MRHLAFGLAVAVAMTGDHVQQPAPVRVVLAEVQFDPGEADTAFVELLNLGGPLRDLTEFVLTVDTIEVPLPRLDTPVGTGARVLIRFDGQGTIDGTVIHAGADVALDTAGGVITLLANDDRVLDRVAWGAAEAAVVPTVGGFALLDRDRGSSLGRPPGANRPGATREWVLYPPDEVTPGAANPLPAVSELLPVHGAVLEATSIELSWYTVPGATRYRVQLATDSSFVEPLVDQTVAGPSVSSGQRDAGRYWWRVQALAEGGAASAWSLPSSIEMGVPDSGGDAEGERAHATRSGGPGDDVDAGVAPIALAVPLEIQRKDSKMLHLESLQEARSRTRGILPNVPHAWDRDHGVLNGNDPADNMNCVLASVAMINRYYGGNLTQDRIGYEVFSRNVVQYRAAIGAPAYAAQFAALLGNLSGLRELAPGPERDLNYGDGLLPERVMAATLFALGVLPGPQSGYVYPGGITLDDLWQTVIQEIDAGRPVLAAQYGHALVIRGYRRAGARRLVMVNDPWAGRYSIDIDAPRVARMRGSPHSRAIKKIFTLARPRQATRQEPSVTRDQDQDGVVDFDEFERFATDPARKDTDNDGVEDQRDIASGVYEAVHGLGYAYAPGANRLGRDYDGDGKPTELDPDSDDGGCKDGEEDTSADGETNGSETDNFDRTDDRCQTLDGTVSYSIFAINNEPHAIARRIYDAATIRVRLKPRAGASALSYVDDSSTFTYRGYARVEVQATPGCIMWGRELAGATNQPFARRGRIGATRGAGTSTVVLGANYDVPSRSRSAGCGGPAGGLFSDRAMNFPDCEGVLTAYPGGLKQYEFDCTTPPDLGPGWSVVSYYARGYLRLK